MYNITPTDKITPAHTIICDEAASNLLPIETAAESWRAIMRKYGVEGPESPMIVDNWAWPPAVVSFIQECDPLRSVMTAENSAAALTLWEVYSMFAAHFGRRRPTDSSRVKDYPIKTFQLFDDTETITRAATKMMQKVRIDSGLNVIWNYLASYRPGKHKPAANWVSTIDGTDELSPANIRFWKNKINIDLKYLDMFMSDTAHLTGPAIVLALIVLTPGGCAAIRCGNFTPKIITLMHLFANNFARTFLVEVRNQLFLCGFEYLSPLNSKYRDLLLNIKWDNDHSIYAARYLENEQFNQFYKVMADTLSTIFSRRVEYFSAVLALNNQLVKSEAARNYPAIRAQLINECCPDRATEWIKMTGYNQVANM